MAKRRVIRDVKRRTGSGDSNRIFWSVLLVSMTLLAAAPPASADKVTFFFKPTAGADGVPGKYWTSISGVEPSNPNSFVNVEASLTCEIKPGATEATSCQGFGSNSPTNTWWDGIRVGDQFTALQSVQAFTELVVQASPFGPSTCVQRWAFGAGGTIPTVFQELVSFLVHVGVGEEIDCRATKAQLAKILKPLPRSQAEFDAELSLGRQAARERCLKLLPSLPPEFRNPAQCELESGPADMFFTFSMSGTSWSAYNSRGSVSVLNHTTADEAGSDRLPAGGTMTTDVEADGATPADVIETTLTTPNAGFVTVAEMDTAMSPPAAIRFLGKQAVVTAPAAAPDSPLVVVFRLDGSLFPGSSPDEIKTFRNGIEVTPCSGAAGAASPDPCVSGQASLPDGDLEITVLTSHAGTWNFGVSKADPTPPTTSASVSPSPNADGWNKDDVTITLTAADDEDGSGVKEIVYRATGAQPIAETTVTGASATIELSAEGETTVTFLARDHAGNEEAPQSLTLHVDKTPPVIVGSRSPAPNPAGWNNTDVTASFACTDELSGIESCGPTPQVVSTEGAGQSRTATAGDRAGNDASDSVSGINIDKTPPATAATMSPAPNLQGWSRTDVSVALSATDTLSGVANVEFNLDAAGWVAFAGPVSIAAEGIHTLLFRSMDRADNVESPKSLTVRIDKTPPEAHTQFDPATQDLAAFGRDSLSGVASLTLVSAVPAPKDREDADDEGEPDDDDGEEDDEGNAELRTYEVMDLAGNSLLLVETVKREGHELKARIMSLQYNGGAVLGAARNREKFEWSVRTDGTLRVLGQKMEVREGKDKQEVRARFEGMKNQTTIRAKEPKPERRLVRPGIVLLRIATDKGKLVIEF